MLLPIKPILDRRPRRNGTNLISIQYCNSSDKRTLLYSGLAVPTRFWNKKQHLPLLHKVEDPVAFLKRSFRPDFDPATLSERFQEMTLSGADLGAVNLDFFYQLDDYIKTKRRKVSAGMIRTYNVVKERLLAFQKCRRGEDHL